MAKESSITRPQFDKRPIEAQASASFNLQSRKRRFIQTTAPLSIPAGHTIVATLNQRAMIYQVIQLEIGLEDGTAAVEMNPMRRTS